LAPTRFAAPNIADCALCQPEIATALPIVIEMRLNSPVPAIAMAGFNLNFGFTRAVGRQGTSDVIRLLELSLPISSNVPLVCACIDQLSFARSSFLGRGGSGFSF